ncbi:TonB-dependent receptor [Maribellus sp. YY47]|uniref:TonB-dependent receptor domain-containing protein n=1 Tax=Maribellus sp. YY47 TaxID=2929486 RepID=UPI002000FEB4|nr:TonB-dependent receptor [Maribellus sp. YY47]MCK3683345.1 TonB-dependent receptor [Maribellus sp. YY47]
MKIKSLLSGTRMFFCVVVFLAIGNDAYSQGKSIKLMDKQDGTPIPDVHYTYNGQSGISDEQGVILLHLKLGETLYLSHVQYGKQSIASSDVISAGNSGILKIQEAENYLLPVTLVLVRPETGGAGTLEFSAQSKLAHDAGALLESVSSISSIRKSGTYGFEPVLRGFKYDQINLVLDGVQTASAACPNRMDPGASQVPINMITQAEILKGPYSLRYGNVFGGTINFKSSEPEFREKATPVGRLGTSYETNGTILRTEGVAGVSGKKADFRVFGAYSVGDDYTDGEGVDIAARFNRLNWGGKLGLKISEAQTLGVMVSNNFAKDVDFPALPMDLRKDNTWLINASHSATFYEHSLSTWKTSLYGTFVNHEMDNLDKVLDPRMMDAYTDASTQNYGGRTELRFNFDRSHVFAGLDYRSESAEGHRTREMLMGPMAGKVFIDNVWQDAEVHRSGLFGEWHVHRTGYQLVFSGRLDMNNSTVNDPDARFSSIYNDLESNTVHPSLSVGGTRFFNEKISLGLWLGRASRSAGIAERYINQFPVGLDPYEMLGNPNLDPEINNQVDLILAFQEGSMRLDINVFASALRDYISSEIRPDLQPAMSSAPGVRQFVNIDKALMTGFEGSWKQQFSDNLSHDLSVAFTYGQNKDADEALPEIPPLDVRYRLTGSFADNKIRPEILLRHSFKQDRVATSYGETKTPEFTVVDAKIAWQISAPLSLSGGVLNLLDTAYYEHLARSVRSAEARPIYSPGRSFYITLSLNFL